MPTSVVQLRLIGTSREAIQAAVNELAACATASGAQVTVDLQQPREGRKGDFLVYGTLAITHCP